MSRRRLSLGPESPNGPSFTEQVSSGGHAVEHPRVRGSFQLSFWIQGNFNSESVHQEL